MTDMPDFDKMTQDEIMRWMESLAKRQGATEGFVTDADADVPDVNEDDERLQNVGEYIPHGWTREQWEAQLAKEAAQKAAKQQSAPPPAPVMPPPPPAPVVFDPSSMSEAEIMAALDKMSPEDSLRFLESLAKGKVPDEQLVTGGGMQIGRVAEDDPRLQGQKTYIPSGLTKDQEAKWLAEEEERQRREREVRETQVAPVASILPPVDDVLKAPSLDDLFSQDNTLPPMADIDTLELPSVPLGSMELGGLDDPMSWLAGLAGEVTPAPSLDLGNLGQSLTGLSDSNAPANPMDWLEGLAAETPGAIMRFDQAKEDAFEEDIQYSSDIDPIAFMETLAREHGASPDELTTPADLEIKRPQAVTEDGPGYQPYTYEDEDLEDSSLLSQSVARSFGDDSGVLDDPEAWLDNLAASANIGRASAEPSVPVDDVMSALNQGREVPPEMIDAFFQKQFERAETLNEEEDEGESFFSSLQAGAEDAELPPIEADTSWLEEMGVVPEISAPAVSADDLFANLGLDQPDLPETGRTSIDEMPNWLAEDAELSQSAASASLELEPMAEMPDWLLADAAEDSGEIIDIFADVEVLPKLSTALNLPVQDLEMDMDDPLVVALTQEAEDQQELAEWYEERSKLMDTGALAALNAAMPETSSAIPTPSSSLLAADLPVETQLPHGEPERMPPWLAGQVVPSTMPTTPEPTASAEPSEGMPDWLQAVDAPEWLLEEAPSTSEEALPDWLAGVDVDIAPEEIPSWLRETMDEGQSSAAPSEPEPAPSYSAPSTVVTPPPVPAPSKSPVPVPQYAQIDVQSTLTSARAQVSQDLEASLQAYESVVRANSALDVVVADLSKLAEDKDHKKNPTVYRVLGDALLRRGDLQDALNTYRKALNLL